MLTFDIVTHDRLRAEEEERKRREREAHDLAQGSMSNLLTLVGTGQVGAVIHQLKDEMGLVVLDKGYQAINSQYPMTKDTFADFLTEYTDPGHLGRTFQTAQDQGILTDPAFTQKTANRFAGLSEVATHARDIKSLGNEDYWRLMSQTDQGADPGAITDALTVLDPQHTTPSIHLGKLLQRAGGTIAQGVENLRYLERGTTGLPAAQPGQEVVTDQGQPITAEQAAWRSYVPPEALQAIGEKANIPLPGGEEIPTGPVLERAVQQATSGAGALMTAVAPLEMIPATLAGAGAGAAAEGRVPGLLQTPIEMGAMALTGGGIGVGRRIKSGAAAVAAPVAETGAAEAAVSAEEALRVLGIKPIGGGSYVRVAEIEQAAADAKTFLAEQRTNLKAARTDLKTATRLGIVDSAVTERVKLSEKATSAAERAYTKAEHAVGSAKVRASIEDFAERAETAGADPEVTGLLKRAYADAQRLVPGTEPLLTAASWRQRLAHWSAAIEGTVPGVVGKIATARTLVEDALRGQTAQKITKLAQDIDEVIGQEADGLKYVGPSKFAGIAEEYRPQVLIQHPEYFEGISPRLQGLMNEAQKVQRGKLAVAEALGYPIKALEDPYLEQVWDIPRSELVSYTQGLRGKVSIAKTRLFGDYVEGIRAGAKPKDMSVGDLIQHSSGLMDKAIADAFERRLVLERFGTRTAGSYIKGRARFGDPLYQGWYGPKEITNFIQVLHNPPPGVVRAVGPVAAAFKNTVFGVADFGVLGVHVAETLGTGGPRVLAASVNRSLQLLHLPSMQVYMDENLPRITQASLDGVHQGIGPAAVTLKGGTVLKYIPGIGKYVDAPVSAAIDALARIQFGGILTPLRNMLYEGNLMTLHLTGQDITNPVVRRVAADNANALTGASRGAMTAGRRGVESIALTSFQMTRSQMAQLTQVAKGAFSPTATAAERIIALTTLANFGVMVYGVGSAVNMAFGEGPIEFNPQRGDWASIHVGGQVVPMIPQRAIVRAIGKSITALQKEDPAQLAIIWTQVASTRLSPVGKVPGAAAGYGFEPGVGFTGNMTPKGRLLNIAPMPPIFSQVVSSFITGEKSQREPVALGLQAVGFNPYEESPYRQLEQFSQAEFGKPLKELERREVLKLKANHPDQEEAIDRQQAIQAGAGDTTAGYYQEVKRVNEDYNGRIAQVADQYPAMADFRQAYNDLQVKRQAALDTVGSNPLYADAVGEQAKRDAGLIQEAERFRKEGKPLTDKHLLALYGDIFERHKGETDTAPMFEDLDAFWAGLSPAETATLDTNLGLTLPPRAQELRAKVKQLQPYFDIPEETYQRLKAKGEKGGIYARLVEPTYDEFRKRVIADGTEKAMSKGKSPQEAAAYALLPDVTRVVAPEYTPVQDVISRDKETWRRKNRDLSALLIELGYNPASRESYRRGTQEEPLVLPLPSGQLTGGW